MIIKIHKHMIPKCPKCGAELGTEFHGVIRPMSFLKSCKCGQKLEWREQTETPQHFAILSRFSSVFNNRNAMVFEEI